MFLTAFALLLALPLVYNCYIKANIIALYHGKNSGVFYALVHLVYPRFFVELQRFELEFFLNHATQVIWRFELVSIIALAAVYFYQKSTQFTLSLQDFWKTAYSEFNDRIYHLITFTAILYYFHDFMESYTSWIQYKEFYQPILLLKVFQIPLWSVATVQILFAIFIGAAISATLYKHLKTSTVVVCLLFILFQGWNYSFGKINHGFALLTYSSMILVVQSYLPQHIKGISLQLIRVTIASCYLMAGLEKLLVSHFAWISPVTFKAYLLLHPTSLGLLVVKNNFLCTLLPSVALAIQLGFVCVLFFPPLKKWILMSGVLFHFGTVALLGISSYLHPWVICYVFFIDWEDLLFKMKKNIFVKIIIELTKIIIPRKYT